MHDFYIFSVKARKTLMVLWNALISLCEYMDNKSASVYLERAS